MGYHRMPASECMGDQVGIRNLKEDTDGRSVVPSFSYVVSNCAQVGQFVERGFKKEETAALSCPVGKFVIARIKLISHFLCTKNTSLLVLSDQPCPESGTKINGLSR